MKKLLIPLLLVLLAAPLVASAQPRDCGNGLPCGAIPWTRFILPRLPSPTPMPTLNVAAVISTPTPGPTVTPGGPTITPTPGLPTVDTSQIQESIETLQAINNATPFAVVNAAGTPVSPQEQFAQVGEDAGIFFGYARSIISPVTFGPIWPLVAFSFTALAVVLIVTATTFLLPGAVAIFGLIRKLISTIMDFIPG